MIPKGNMMASTLKKVDAESYDLIEFRCSNKKETPEENRELEAEFKQFLEKGISRISRQGTMIFDIHFSLHSLFIRRHTGHHGRSRDQDRQPGPDAQETGGRQESCYDCGQQESKKEMKSMQLL